MGFPFRRWVYGTSIGLVLLVGCTTKSLPLPAPPDAEAGSGHEFAHLTDENFGEMVNAESGVVLVDFYASWCGPCRTQAKVLQDAAPSLSGVTIVKVDVDAAPGLSSKFNVSSIPTLIVFKSGEQVAKQVGLTEGNALKSMIAKAK